MPKDDIILTEVEKKLKDFNSSFMLTAESTWGGFLGLIPQVFSTAWQFWKDKDVETIHAAWDGFLQMYLDAGYLTPKVKDTLLSMKDMMFPIDVFMFMGQVITLGASYLMAVNAPASSVMMQQMNRDQRPAIPQYRDVLQAAFIAPEKTDAVRDIMKRNGFTDDDIDLLFLANYRMYDVTTIQILYLRKLITEDQMMVRMKELGFTDTRIKEIIQTWEVLPTPQDLLYMVAKEAFEPDIIELIGLDDEFPEDQVEFMNKQGVSREWALKYWYAHWDQPSISMGFEMLHRGVIGWEELNVLFKAVEMPPFWRDKLTEVAFTPYSRVDVRRMHDMDVLGPAEINTAYHDIGYDDIKAAKMTEFTIAYNAKNNKELTKTQLINSYIDGLITRADAKAMILTLKYPEELAEFLLIMAEYQHELDYQNDLVKNIGDRYKNNLITKREALDRLGKLNLPATRVTILTDKWEIATYKDMKVPSKTDMEKFFLNGYWKEDDYLVGLDKLGYNFSDAENYVKLSKLKMV